MNVVNAFDAMSYDNGKVVSPFGGAADYAELRIAVIDVFVHLSQALGLPKSVGEIYGFLFVSEEPASFEDVVNALGISSGSASTGLRLLRSIGAVTTTYVVGDRRDYFVAEIRLRKLVAGFLRENIEPQLLSSDERLFRIGELLARLQPADQVTTTLAFFKDRVGILRAWQDRARLAVPAVLDVLQR